VGIEPTHKGFADPFLSLLSLSASTPYSKLELFCPLSVRFWEYSNQLFLDWELERRRNLWPTEEVAPTPLRKKAPPGSLYGLSQPLEPYRTRR
jgi:hypothetical protein